MENVIKKTFEKLFGKLYPAWGYFILLNPSCNNGKCLFGLMFF